MIYDRVEELSCYAGVHEDIQSVLAYLERTDINSLQPEEKYEVGNRGSFVFLTRYQTKPEAECFIETHQRFIDLQIMLEGSEGVGLVPLADTQIESYDEEKDVRVHQGTTQTITFKQGEFLIFFPQDGHMPTMQTGQQPESLTKLVFKLLV